MKKRQSYRILSSLLALLLVFSLFSPIASASSKVDELKQTIDPSAALEMRSAIEEQLELAGQKSTLHENLKDATGEVKVIVHLSEYPVALVKGINASKGKSFSKAEQEKVIKKVKSQQEMFVEQLSDKKIKYKKGYAFNEVLNGMGLTLDASDLPELLEMEGVTFVEPDTEMVALGGPSSKEEMSVSESTDSDVGTYMATSIEHLGVKKLWNDGYKGQGVKVGVIDTGIDYNHPEFEGVYKGGKSFVVHTPAEYTSTREANDPYETSPNERPASMPEFNANGDPYYTSHGTHVAGTIAAQGKNPNGIQGLSPEVELYAYRVLGAYGSGSSTWVIAGIEQAVKDGMKVINLSLGSRTNDANAANSFAVNNAMLAGVVTLVATGNAGASGRGTIGSPSAASMAISVGNSTNPETTRKANVAVSAGSYVNEDVLNMMSWTFGQDPAQTLTGEYDLKAVPGVGKVADYAGLDVTGKIVLVARGEIAFVDKIEAAKAAGAKGLIIHNSQAGTGSPGPSNVFLNDSFAFLPAFDMSYTDGMALRTELGTNVGKVTFSNYVVGATAGDVMTASSSQGPANPNFDIKPDVVAPGTNIMSSVAAYGKHDPNANYEVAYDRYSGTSMATPHIAGISALIVQKHPEWTPFDVKVALSNTAKRLDITKFDVFSQGPGRVQPEIAAYTKAVAHVSDTTKMNNSDKVHTRGTISFGKVPPSKDKVVTITKDIVVKNLGSTTDNYTVEVQTTKNAAGAMAAAKVSVDQTSFALSNEQTVKVTLELPAGESTPGNEILGYITINSADTILSLPFAADLSPVLLTGVKNYKLRGYHISPDGDGKMDNTILDYEFHEEQTLTLFQLWDAINYTGGPKGDGYLGVVFAAAPTPVGPKQLTVNGDYTVAATGAKAKAPEGVYTVDMAAISKVTGKIVGDDDGPLFIKTSDPVIETDAKISSTDMFTGKVVDKYVDFKAPVEFMFDGEYDVNHFLANQYEVYDKENKVINSGTFALNDDGTYAFDFAAYKGQEVTVKMQIDDAAGNSTTKYFKVVNGTVTPKDSSDMVAPVTTAVADGVVGEAFNNKDVKVTFTAVDTDSGVKETSYRVNNGEWKVGNEVVVTTEGTNTVEYKSEDNAGNAEEAKSLSINIDKTAAIIDAPDTLTIQQDEGLSISIKVEDALSGVKQVAVKLDGAPASTEIVIEPNKLTVGTHTIEITAEDNAGNISNKVITVNVVEKNIDIDLDQLDEFLQTGIDSKAVDKNIGKSLNQKILHAQRVNDAKTKKSILTAIINETNAQSGKKIDKNFADKFIEVVTAIQNSL